jgi:hypothetical protein
MILPLIIGVGYLGIGSLTSLYMEHRFGREPNDPKHWIVLDILFWPLLWYYIIKAIFLMLFTRTIDKR